MISVFFAIGFLIGMSLFVVLLEHRSHQEEENRITKTGESYGERWAYHQRGELSPGELARAHAIRERLAQLEQEGQ